MAVTQSGALLTEAHRLEQSRIAEDALRQALLSWALLRYHDVDASFPVFAQVMLSILADHKRRSAWAAANYLQAFRSVEGVGGEAPLVLLEELSRQQALTSLLVTGPATIKTATRKGLPEDEAMRLALAKTLKAATRLVLQGGRDTIMETVRRDRQALGWARITRGQPCYFCAMLASRGAVYKTHETARFQPHDGCGCQPEPVYSEDWEMPESSRRFETLWAEATRDAAPGEAAKAFRRAYEHSLRNSGAFSTGG